MNSPLENLQPHSSPHNCPGKSQGHGGPDYFVLIGYQVESRKVRGPPGDHGPELFSFSFLEEASRDSLVNQGILLPCLRHLRVSGQAFGVDSRWKGDPGERMTHESAHGPEPIGDRRT